MEIIYHVKNGIYPFKCQKESDHTQVQYVIEVGSQGQKDYIKQFSKNYKSINCPYLMKLFKVLKEDEAMHLLYQYFDNSIQNYLTQNPSAEMKRIQTEVACAFKCLETHGVKVYVKIENIGVDQNGVVKIFVGPDGEETYTKEDLQEFYSTQKTRIRVELEEIWEKYQSKKQIQEKVQKNPGFIISGNQLIFIKNQSNSPNKPAQEEANENSGGEQNPQALPREATNSHLTKNILTELERQRDITEKLKQRRLLNLKAENECVAEEKVAQKYTSPQSKDPQPAVQPQQLPKQHMKGMIKKSSMDSDHLSKRQAHRNGTGCVNLLIQKPLEKTNEEMAKTMNIPPVQTSNSGTNISSNMSLPAQNSAKEKSFEEVENKNERSREEKKDYLKVQKVKEKSRNSQDNIQIALSKGDKAEEDGKIQITTQMVSKYKMKIVTCQQIQFQGKEGDNLEELAKQKLLEYQAQHRYPPMLEQANEQSPIKEQEIVQTKEEVTECASEVVSQVQTVHAEVKPAIQQQGNDDIISKINKAKEKASTALKEYAKNKKK